MNGIAPINSAKTRSQTPLQQITQWFDQQGWRPWPYQRKAWQSYKRGESGLIHVPTGAGKTYAALMGPVMELMATPKKKRTAGLKILLITPLRSLSRDTEKAIQAPITDMGLDISVETRSGDTKQSVRRRQRNKLPDILITTPESFSLLLSYANAHDLFAQLRCVVVDEWHELVGTKRGLQLELNVSRVRQFAPQFQIWAMSATLAQPIEAAKAIVGNLRHLPKPVVVDAKLKRPVVIRTLLPDDIQSFPWAGYLGLIMLPKLVNHLDIQKSALIFTNTRAQAERWFQEILAAKPEWAGLLALHHGSLDEKNRRFVEDAIKSGLIKLVVCTSSLDLGVDFPLVEQVIQIGSPKGVARLMQRAGRAKHRVGETCEIICVPTNALQILEFAAVRQAIDQNNIEPNPSHENAYDVLAQHVVTCAAGGGFSPDDMYQAVITAHSYRNLTWKQFNWVIELVEFGGANLKAYPEYHKIENLNGQYGVKTPRLEQIHRMNIGTISSDSQMVVRFAKGKKLGYVEEGFVAKLKRGDRFVFAGRNLELFRVEDDAALVKLSKRNPNVVAKWSGSRMPISESLGAAMREVLATSRSKTKPSDEIKSIQPILASQADLSALPTHEQLLIELCKTREGYHCFIYPFEGRIVHEGLAPLLALRMARSERASISLSVDDYGMELFCKTPFDFEAQLNADLFSQKNLIDDIVESINLSNLSKRQFRDIARIAGLVQQNYPGKRHTARQLQTSASLLFDVFQRYDPSNLLITQAQEETLAQYFELPRLKRCLQRLGKQHHLIKTTNRPTPFAFPLIAERVTSTLSNESAVEALKKLSQRWDVPV